MSSNLKIMALTATGTWSLMKQVESLLEMINPAEIIRSPDKINIAYSNVDIRELLYCF